ncbi:hypothetical protein O6H91_03G127700 [Diphasiastrum complanatum]|nr:hypothetical protein O6H91_03G127700 [Diphasiastrum complanatum]
MRICVSRSFPLFFSLSPSTSLPSGSFASRMCTFSPVAMAVDTKHADLKAENDRAKLVIVGHRGCGKNRTYSVGETPDFTPSIRENTITSFNLAAKYGADFVEFDVQVTKDGHAIIFHDDLIIAEDMVPSSIGNLTLEEFLSFGPQKESNKIGKTLVRVATDGTVSVWSATVEDSLCTLKEAFEQVEPIVGFNIEVKFDDINPVSQSELERVVTAVVQEVEQHAKARNIFFSSFHPDAVGLLQKSQSKYPVFFLTDGGTHLYADERRNSIEAAMEVCNKSGLQGIVSEVKGVLQNPNLVAQIKKAELHLFTYGDLNNVPEVVQKQKDLGVDGVIVDHVLEIVTACKAWVETATLEVLSTSGLEQPPSTECSDIISQI